MFTCLFCFTLKFCLAHNYILFIMFCLLPVISVPEQVAEKLEPSDDSSGPSYIDYSERRSLPISIPDYHYNEGNGEKYVVN